MIACVLRVAATLAVSAIVISGLFWGLLNTPDSNALMLGVSALLALTILAAAGVAITAGVLIARGVPLRDAVVTSPRGMGLFLLAFAPLAIAWFALGWIDAWIAEHHGEINASLIARFGWADITWLLRAETWTSRWLRWYIVPSICLSMLAALLTSETAPTWLRRALHWRTLLIGTIAFVVFMALPWQLTVWRPQLPPTWIQPVVAAIRLATTFILGVTGAALVVVIATREPRRT